VSDIPEIAEDLDDATDNTEGLRNHG